MRRDLWKQMGRRNRISDIEESAANGEVQWEKGDLKVVFKRMCKPSKVVR